MNNQMRAQRAWAQAACPDVVRALDALAAQIAELTEQSAALEAKLPWAGARGVPLHLVVFLEAVEKGETLDIIEANRRVAEMHKRLLQQR